MKKTLTMLLFGILVTLGAAAISHAAGYYVCGCPDSCNCGCMSAEPGNCCCGTEMKEMSLLSIEDGVANFCACGAGCACGISKDDPSKCACGKPVRKVGLKGKYVCGCGPSCTCGTISDKPGNCGCGKPLKLVE